MQLKPKTIVRASVKGTAETHSRTLLEVRDLVDVSDEPVERGGANEGFAPTEMLIAALVSCSNVISHKIAAKHGIEIVAMTVEADYSLDRRGVTLQEEVEIPFPDIRLTIRVTTSASEREFEIVQRDLPKYCAVSKVISESGTDIKTEWIIGRP